MQREINWSNRTLNSNLSNVSNLSWQLCSLSEIKQFIPVTNSLNLEVYNESNRIY